MSDDVECNANDSLSLQDPRADISNDSHHQMSKIVEVHSFFFLPTPPPVLGDIAKAGFRWMLNPADATVF